MTLAFPQIHTTEQYVRPLLIRSIDYVVPTSTLVAYTGAVIVREQFEHCVEQTVEWTLAMFNVRTATGDPAIRSIEKLGEEIADDIDDAVGENEVSLHTAIEKVHAVLGPVFGRQLRVTGWLPGHRVAEGRSVLELSGDPCPRCTVNPTGYKVGDKTNTARCLNSEDCGWTSA